MHDGSRGSARHPRGSRCLAAVPAPHEDAREHRLQGAHQTMPMLPPTQPHGALPRVALQFYGPCRLGVCTNEQDVEFPAIRRAGRAHSKHPGMLVAWRELLLTDMLLPRGQGPCMPQHPPPPAPNSALDRPLCCRRFKWTPPSCQRPCCPLPPCRASRWGLFTWLRGQKFLLTL